MMRYFVHNPLMLNAMLKEVNKNSIDDLFSSIPPQARLKTPLDLPKKLDELQIKKKLQFFLSPPPYKSFLGAGACEHFVPEWISQQLLRAEWYTSYTPYQPEASQGTLQAIFEFQSMVASLFGLSFANASMYDGATALTEALLMAIRTKGKKTVLLSKTIHPEYRETAKTYLSAAGYKIVEIFYNQNGVTDQEQVKTIFKDLKSDIAAIAIQSPNFFGLFENVSSMISMTKIHDAFFIGCNTDASSCALFSFGKLGADIAIGEGLGLLGGISLGGPGVGLFACKKELLRQMPGRLIGETTDKNGRTGYVLTLSTREQHIKREKATSNICTNHNLMALAFSMTLSAYGKTGFFNLAKTNVKKSLYFRQCLQKLGKIPIFLGPHYNETIIKLDSLMLLEKRLNIALKRGMIAGLPLKKFYPELYDCLMVATTELHEDEEIKLLAEILAGTHDD
jgi:glycine dehydrogenase subunit 1